MSSQVAFGGRELAHWPRLERGGDGLPIILACLGLSATGQLTAARCPAAAGWSAAAGRGGHLLCRVPPARRVHAELPCHE